MQSDRESASPNSMVKAEPATKRQKLNEHAPPVQQSLDIIDIDPDGDLLLIFGSHQTAYKVDSRAIRRASPVLYKSCQAVRPDDGSDWTFEEVPEICKEGAMAILNLIHAKMDQVEEPMHFMTVHDAAFFATHYDMYCFYGPLNDWYDRMAVSRREKTCNCCRLWVAYQIGHEDDFKDLQKWAILNLSDDGEGALGDLTETDCKGKPLYVSDFSCSDTIVIGKVIHIRGGRLLPS